MAKSECHGPGDLGNQRQQVQSSVSVGKPAAEATAAESTRGDTTGSSSGGPTELPPQFGRYRVKKKLGGGGMGTVYLVENTELEREEALKVPHFSAGSDPQLRERFLREAKSAAKLDHANLCPVYKAGVQDGIYYMTMRFLKGKLLTDYTGTAQPPRKAVEIVTKLAQALESAHAKGVIHRDLKPSNVMMVADLGPVVMDFGLAKQVKQADQKLTQAGSSLGTPSYMPPEQVNGDLEKMGPASDVYSLGVILYELLTGRLPFEGTMAMIFGQILYTEPPLPSTLVPGLNQALDGICRKAMAKAPAARYPSMKAFAAVLMDYLRRAPATDSGRNLVPTTVDKAAIFQAPTVAPGPRPANAQDAADIMDAIVVEPGDQTVSAFEVPPRAVKAIPVAPARSSRSRRFKPSRLPWALGGVAMLLAGVVGAYFLATIILRVETKAGTVLLEIDQKDAEVYVDGDKITIGRPGDKNTITVEAKEGKHLLRVTKPGFEAWTDDITFRDKEPYRVKISLKPVAVVQNLPKEKKQPPPQALPAAADAFEASFGERFVPLFNGKDKTGWKMDPSWEDWHVEQGVLVGTGRGPLRTERDDFKDFHLRVQLRIAEGTYNHFMVRNNLGTWKGGGYSIVLNSTNGNAQKTGSLIRHGKGPVVRVSHSPIPPGQWFTLEVIAEADRLVVKVAGQTTADYTDPERSFTAGHIVLAPVGTPNRQEFRKIEIKELPAK